MANGLIQEFVLRKLTPLSQKPTSVRGSRQFRGRRIGLSEVIVDGVVLPLFPGVAVNDRLCNFPPSVRRRRSAMGGQRSKLEALQRLIRNVLCQANCYF
jgi:hypothetical protein